MVRTWDLFFAATAELHWFLAILSLPKPSEIKAIVFGKIDTKISCQFFISLFLNCLQKQYAYYRATNYSHSMFLVHRTNMQ